MTWPCPSCGQEWPEKPLVDGTIGCPECGSIADPCFGLRSNLEGAREMLAPFAKWPAEPLLVTVDAVVARLSAAEQERDEVRERHIAGLAATRGRIKSLKHDRSRLRSQVRDLTIRAEAAEQALRGLMAALAVDAEGNLTGDFGQWSDAWLVAGAALAGREETP